MDKLIEHYFPEEAKTIAMQLNFEDASFERLRKSLAKQDDESYDECDLKTLIQRVSDLLEIWRTSLFKKRLCSADTAELIPTGYLRDFIPTLRNCVPLIHLTKSYVFAAN